MFDCEAEGNFFFLIPRPHVTFYRFVCLSLHAYIFLFEWLFIALWESLSNWNFVTKVHFEVQHFDGKLVSSGGMQK